MLNISEKALQYFSNPSTQKTFLVRVNFPTDFRFYSTDTFIVFDLLSMQNFVFKGKMVNEPSFVQGFDVSSNSVNKTNIGVKLIEELNLFELSKSIELNSLEAYVYFYANGLELNNAIPLIKGILNIDTVGLDNEEFNFTITDLDNKFDSVFPPVKVDSNLPWVLNQNDAEKYTGESIPIIFGEVNAPGVPLVLYYDNATIRRYAIANHPVSQVGVLADGVFIPIIPTPPFTINYDAVNNISYVETSGSNYEMYFKGKKITASCRGLLYDSPANPYPSLVDVIKYILQNYTNLQSSDIDLSDINLQGSYLSGYKVSRYFNGESTAFNSINELSSEYPFLFVDRGFKKSIVAVDTAVKPFTYTLTYGKNLFDRDRNIKISKPDNLYNSFSVKYKYDGLNNRWGGLARANKSNNTLCLSSYNRIGLEKEKQSKLLYSIYDDVSAENVLDYLVDTFSRFKYIVNYQALHSEVIVEVGDGVLLTDRELNIDNKKFIVISKTINNDFVILSLMNVETIE